MKYGRIVTLEQFEQWMIDGKIDGQHVDANEVYQDIQTRVWECPTCKEEGYEHRIEHSLEATIDVGNPICPEGHDMELFDDDE